MSLGGSYDESLLRSAPAATREQLQEGYNADLLAAPVRSKSVHQSKSARQVPSGAAPQVPPAPLLTGTSSDIEQGTTPGPNPTNSYTALGEKAQENRKQPFWRTKTGILLIIIAIVVIIGAVVGGAVGGSVNKNKNKNNNKNDVGSVGSRNQTTISTVEISSTPSNTISTLPPNNVSAGAPATTSPVNIPPITLRGGRGEGSGVAVVPPLLLDGAFAVVRNKQAASLPRPTGPFY